MNPVYRDLAVGFHRLNKTPLDDSCVLDSPSKVKHYINNGTAYDGQRLTVYHNGTPQQIILVKNNNEIVPMLATIPGGGELIVKMHSGTPYVMVYYYNTGREYSSKADVMHTEHISWDILPYACIISDANETEPTNYMLMSYEDKYFFTQKDFFYYVTDNPTMDLDNPVNGILNNSSSKYWWPTHSETIGIGPKSVIPIEVSLWVKASKYCAALGVR